MNNQEKILIPLERVIAFSPVLSRLFGGVNEAIYFQQLYYWSDKGARDDGWIYKKKVEIEEETTLTRDQQDPIRKKLEKLGYLETRLIKANGAPTLHYKINAQKVNEDLMAYSNVAKPTNGLVENPLMETSEIHDSSYIQKITTKTTTYTEGVSLDNLNDEQETNQPYKETDIETNDIAKQEAKEKKKENSAKEKRKIDDQAKELLNYYNEITKRDTVSYKEWINSLAYWLDAGYAIDDIKKAINNAAVGGWLWKMENGSWGLTLLLRRMNMAREPVNYIQQLLDRGDKKPKLFRNNQPVDSF